MRTVLSGFTLIELLVVIAIIAILAGILFPVFAGARNRAYQTQCTSNLKQLQVAMRQYIIDFDGCYPEQVLVATTAGVPMRWVNSIYRYCGGGAGIFECPTSQVFPDLASRPEPRAPLPETSYYYCAYALGGTRDSVVKSPAGTISLMDGWFFENEGGPSGRNYPLYYSPWATPQVMADWVNNLPSSYVGVAELERMHSHNGGLNLAFVDGHVKWATTATPGQFTLAADD